MSYTRDHGFEVPVPVHATRETDKALLVTFDTEYEGETETWVPQSQIHDDSEVWQTGDSGALVVTPWFARQRGWTED